MKIVTMFHLQLKSGLIFTWYCFKKFHHAFLSKEKRNFHVETDLLLINSFIKSCKPKHWCLKYTDKSWQKFNYKSSFTWYCCEKFFKIFFIFTWRFCFSFDRSEKKNLSKQNISVKIILTKVEKSKRHVHNIGTKSFFFFQNIFISIKTKMMFHVDAANDCFWTIPCKILQYETLVSKVYWQKLNLIR